MISPRPRRIVATSWEPLAEWYGGWVGNEGSRHPRKVAIPALLDLLAPQAGERIPDLGAGQIVLASYIANAGIANDGASYTGVDASETLIRFARHHHGRAGRFLCEDVRNLYKVSGRGDSLVSGVARGEDERY
jgi:hypothetical protein